MLTPGAALTIAATLLGGATEQTIRYLAHQVTQEERPSMTSSAQGDPSASC
jgi:hypothetical protein